MFGQVKNPGGYAVQKNTTVLQALSLAGGVTEHGATSRIKIVRIVNGEKSEIKGEADVTSCSLATRSSFRERFF